MNRKDADSRQQTAAKCGEQALHISAAVRGHVYERDRGCCVLCSAPDGVPNARYIPRTRRGLATERNVLTLCPRCLYAYGHTAARKRLRKKLRAYLESWYPDWDEEMLICREHGGFWR